MIKNTATKLKKGILVLLVAVLVLSGVYGVFVDYQTAFAATQLDSMYEYHNPAFTSAYNIYTTNWQAQTFTPSDSHTVTSVWVYLGPNNSNGPITVGIYDTSGDKPTGSALCSGTSASVTSNAWYYITLGAGTALTASTEYAIVASMAGGDATHTVQWVYKSGATYSGGDSVSCPDEDGDPISGTWTVNTGIDLLFSEWGPGQYYSGTPSIISEEDSSYPTVAQLDSDTVVAAFNDSDGYPACKVGEVNSSFIIYSPSDYVAKSAIYSVETIVALSDTQFVVAYSNGTTTYSKVGTVTGDVIEYSASEYSVLGYLGNSADNVFDSSKITSSSFAFGIKTGNTNEAGVIVGSVTGTGTTASISYGSYVALTSNIMAVVDTLSETRIAVAWTRYNSPTLYIYTAIYNVSGTTLTYVDSETVLSVSTSTSTNVAIAALSSSSWVVTYYNKSNLTLYSKVCTASGDVISVGNSYEIIYGTYVDSTEMIDSTHFIVTLRASGTTPRAGFVYGEVDGTSIEFGAITHYTDSTPKELNTNNSVCVLSGGYVAISYVDDDDGDYTKTVIVHSQTFPVWQPVVSTDSATSISDDDVTLNGTLDYDGDEECEYRFGITTIQGGPYYYTSWSVGAALTTTDTFDTTLTDELWAGQTFYYVAECDNGYTGTGDEEDFTTTGVYDPDSAPTVTTGVATPVTNSTATLYGAVTGLGDYATVYGYIQYGTTTSYGSSTAEQTLTSLGEYHDDITGLAPGTVYHYRAIVRYHTYAFAYGDDLTFLTTGSTSTIPIVSTSPATSVTTTGATLNGALTTLGLYSSALVGFEYDLDISDGDYEFSTPWLTYTTATGFSTAVTGLEVDRTYHFRATCLYGAGSQTNGDDLTFVTDQTGIVPIPPGVLPGETGIESLPDNVLPIWSVPSDAYNTPAGAPTDNPIYEPIDIINTQTNTGFTTDQVFFWGAAVLTVMVCAFCLIKFRTHLLVSGIATMACIAFFVGWNGIFPYWLLFPAGAFLLWSLNSERQPSV